MRAEILDVQQCQRHAGTTQLEVERRAVRLRTHACGRSLRVQTLFDLCVRQRLDGREVEPERGCVRDDAGQRARTDTQRPRHLAVAALQRELLSQELSYVTHGESLCRHAAS